MAIIGEISSLSNSHSKSNCFANKNVEAEFNSYNLINFLDAATVGFAAPMTITIIHVYRYTLAVSDFTLALLNA